MTDTRSAAVRQPENLLPPKSGLGMPFGPSIAVGYAAVVLLLPVFNPILEGPYS